MQAVLDFERIVHVRVVDQAFPADGGAGFFKIHTHHQIQRVADFFGQIAQTGRVFFGRIYVMNGAGANHNENTVVFAIENIAHDLTAILYAGNSGFAAGHVGFQLFRRNQRNNRLNIEIFYAIVSHSAS